MRPFMHRRRYNPDFTIADFAAFIRAKLGDEDFAYEVESMPHVVTPFLPKIKARLISKGLLADDAVAESGTLTDRQAWSMLADLVPSALSDQPKALQDALVAEFRAEASRAAA